MKDLDLRWFDEIYESGEVPSLEQRAQLSAQVQFHFPERTKREIEETYKQCVYQLGQAGGYSRGLHTLTYEILVSLLPKVEPDTNKMDDYVAQFRRALAKHNTEISSPRALASNFR